MAPDPRTHPPHPPSNRTSSLDANHQPPPRPSHPHSHARLPTYPRRPHLRPAPSQVPPYAPPPPPRTADSCYVKLADNEWCYEAGATTQETCESYFFERLYGCGAPHTLTSERSLSLGTSAPLTTHATSHQGWLPILQVGERLLPCRRSHTERTDHLSDYYGAAFGTHRVLRHQPARRHHHQVLLPAHRGHLDPPLCLLLPPG